MPEHIDVPKVYLQIVSATGDGMNLEMCAGTPDGRLSAQGPYPIAWFRADVEGEVKFVLETHKGTVSLPLSELERAIQIAKKEVHCERFYDDPEGAA